MPDCKKCLNALLRLGASRKRRIDLHWPNDFECIQRLTEFPYKIDCDEFVDREK